MTKMANLYITALIVIVLLGIVNLTYFVNPPHKFTLVGLYKVNTINYNHSASILSIGNLDSLEVCIKTAETFRDYEFKRKGDNPPPDISWQQMLCEDQTTGEVYDD